MPPGNAGWGEESETGNRRKGAQPASYHVQWNFHPPESSGDGVEHGSELIILHLPSVIVEGYSLGINPLALWLVLHADNCAFTIK